MKRQEKLFRFWILLILILTSKQICLAKQCQSSAEDSTNRIYIISLSQAQLPQISDTFYLCSIGVNGILFVDGIASCYPRNNDTIGIAQIQMTDSDYLRTLSFAKSLETSYQERYSVCSLDGVTTIIRVNNSQETKEVVFDNVSTKRLNDLFNTINMYLRKAGIPYSFDMDSVGFFDDEIMDPRQPNIQINIRQ